jgi:serine protease
VDTGITTVTQNFSFKTWNGTAIQTVAIPYSTNPDLASSRLVTPVDLIFWTGPVLDMVGHGTHVSSTIGEDTNNNLAESGIAYGVKIMPVKVCVGFWEIQFALSAGGTPGRPPLGVEGCPDDAIAQGIQYAADNGAKVINLSLGGEEPSITIQNALKYAVGKGAFIAIAAGNSHDEGNPVEYPAAYGPGIDGAMTVGAVGPSLARSYFSETGPYIEIAAPGGSDREGGAAGAIWQATLYPFDFDQSSVLMPRFDRYAEVPYQGTSMASPHVAGTAALIMSQGVTNPAAIEAVIKRTARDLGPAGRDDEYGYGLIQPRTAIFGFGLGR